MILKTQVRYVPDGEEEPSGRIPLGRYIAVEKHADGTETERPATELEVNRYRRIFGALDAGAELE